jgi:hypothetical protein
MAASLQLRLTGGAGNSDPNASLGGTMSSTQVSGTAMNNLFDNVSAAEASAGDVEYRAIDIYNNGDAPATSVTLWWDTQTPSAGSVVACGVDATATQTLGNENTAPSAPTVTFTEPTSGSPLSLTDITNGQARRIFIRRTITAGAGNIADDLCGMTIQYA